VGVLIINSKQKEKLVPWKSAGLQCISVATIGPFITANYTVPRI